MPGSNRKRKPGRKGGRTSMKDQVFKSMTVHNIRYGQEPLSRKITPSDIIHELKFNCNPIIYTVTTGAVAGASSITANAINNWATRIAVLFKEYCMVKAHFRIWAMNGTGVANLVTTGVWQVWASETDTTTPNVSDALNNNVISVANNSQVDRISTITWTLSSGYEAQWTSTATATVSFLCLKVFANVANFGFTSGDSSSKLYIEPNITFLFRGLTNT